MGRPQRILVTGSRTWLDRRRLHAEVVRYISDSAVLEVDSQGIAVNWNTTGWVIVHGACPTGADALADDFAVQNFMEQEEHPADWKAFGKRAGFKRNAEMVALGADVCLAFIAKCNKSECRSRPPHGSHGASHCADLAESSGIETRRFKEGNF